MNTHVILVGVTADNKRQIIAEGSKVAPLLPELDKAAVRKKYVSYEAYRMQAPVLVGKITE